MEDWRNPGCLTNGFDNYASYNGRASWGGRSSRSNCRAGNSRPSSRPNSRRNSNDMPPELIAKSNNQKSKGGSKRQAQPKMREKKETRAAEVAEAEPVVGEIAPASAPPSEPKPAPPAVVVNSEQPEEVQEEFATEEDKEKEKEDLIVAAKNEENNKQTASMKTNDSSHAQVIEKVALKHNYKEDQWSPINQKGKKKYDRDFIMELMHDPLSKLKPDNLIELDYLKDTKQRPPDRNFLNNMSRTHGDSLMPNFANKNSSQRVGVSFDRMPGGLDTTPGWKQSLQKKGSQQGKPKSQKAPVIHMSLSLHQDVKLHEAENAWKPTRVQIAKVELTEEEAKTEALYKRVRGVLNKLTPQKFSKLVDQVRTLPIDNRQRLEGVIDLVFQKAVDEPSFSVAYAGMCKELEKMQVPSGAVDRDGKPVIVNFKKLLINRCQNEFEKNTAAERKRDEKLKELELETDPEKKKTLLLAEEEEERKIRRKSVGNVRFIGELYKLQMLTIKIMHNCIGQLLGDGDEESLECLCKLMTTIGQSLESQGKEISDKRRSEDEKKISQQNKGNKGQAKDNSGNTGHSDNTDMDYDLGQYFKKLNDIVRNKGSGKVSSRVRFMIQDLIDLRSNKWVPRRDDSNPKTIDQIQKEVDRETMEMNIALNSPQERNKRLDSRNSIDNKKRGGTDSDGWKMVSSQSNSRSNNKLVVESSKLKIDTEPVTTLSLGNRNQFLWNTAGKGEEKRPQLSANKYALLEDKVSQPGSRSSSLKGSSYTDRDRMLSSYKSNTEDAVRSSRSSSQQGPGSRSSSRDSITSSKRDDRRYANAGSKPQAAPAAPAQPAINPVEALPPELFLKKAKNLFEEYLSINDLAEATLCLLEIPPCNRNELINYVSTEALDKKGPQPKRAVGRLMNYFIKLEHITKEQYLEGLSGVLDTVEDLAIDVPKVWEYLAELLVDMIEDEVLSFRDIAGALGPLRKMPGLTKFFAWLMGILLKDKGPGWIEQRWILSKVSLEEFVNPKDIENFVKQNNVEFLTKENAVNNLTMDTIQNQLTRMMTQRASFDDITNWISTNVNRERISEVEFARALMTAILEVTVIKMQTSFKLDKGLLQHYDQLIIRYTDHSEKLELPCLFAVQAFVHKLEHPQSLIHTLFEYLWENELIAIETFKLWRDSTDPHEQEGHGVCTKSLTSFFTVLNEVETDDES